VKGDDVDHQGSLIQVNKDPNTRIIHTERVESEYFLDLSGGYTLQGGVTTTPLTRQQDVRALTADDDS
jgi:hypothetical protein